MSEKSTNSNLDTEVAGISKFNYLIFSERFLGTKLILSFLIKK